MTAATPLDGLKAIIAFMSPARWRQMWAAFALMLLGSIAEVFSIAAVLPFLALLADPEAAARVPALQFVFEWFGWSANGDLLIHAITLLIAAVLIAAAIRLLLSWVSYRFVLDLGRDIGVEIYSRLLRQPYAEYVKRNSSELVAGIEKVQVVIFAVLLPLMQAVVAGFIALVIVGLLIAIDPKSAILAAVTMTVAYVLVSLAIRRILQRNSRLLSNNQTERVRLVQEALGGIRDILIDQSQPVFEQAFRKLDTSYRRAQAVNTFLSSGPRFVVESVGIIFIAALALLMTRENGGLAAALPVIGALALGAQRLLPLLQLVYSGWSQYVGAGQILVDVLTLLRAPVSGTRPRDLAAPSAPLQAGIRLKDVSFRYSPDGGDALSKIDLVIGRGEHIGFVGKTGSGKSTLIDIVMGLLAPTSGEIEIDGRRLDDLSLAEWQAKIGHVPQSIYLADNSIAANIAFGVAPGSIDFERVRDVAERAQIDEFIGELPHGYDTNVGERGVRLSGGQRQRIGIARALYKGASVLILDEATSALDDETEAAVIRSLIGIGGELTVLMIAHRLSTLANCDRIVQLDRGKIVASGGYDEMVAAPSRRTSRLNG